MNTNYFKIEAKNYSNENQYASASEIEDLMFSDEIENKDKIFTKENEPMIVEYGYNEETKEYEKVSFTPFYVSWFGMQQQQGCQTIEEARRFFK